MRFRSANLASCTLLALLCGCSQQLAHTPAGDHEHKHAHAPGLQHYQSEPGDPAWLTKAGEFHGHLGPWLVLGAMIGRDAMTRLNTDGYWDLEVIYYLPPGQQRQPWSCLLDGVQITTGATLGKQNIRMANLPSTSQADPNRPVVFIGVRQTDGRPAVGYTYRVNDRLAQWLGGMSPDRLESMSREIARQRVSELFEICPSGPLSAQ